MQRLVFNGLGLATEANALHGKLRARELERLAEAEALATRHGIAMRASGLTSPLTSLQASDDARPWSGCQRPWTLAYVTANGNVLPCCISPWVARDYAGLILGNAFDERFATIWNGAALPAVPHRLRDDRAARPVPRLRTALEHLAVPPPVSIAAHAAPRRSESLNTIAVAIMAKAPRPGEVKTRLCPPFLAAEAAALYRLLPARQDRRRGRARQRAADDRLYAGRSAGRVRRARAGLRARSAAGPGPRRPAARDAWRPARPRATPAPSPSTATRRPFRATSSSRRSTALARPGPDVVLGPTEDGGYYLIGVRAAHRELFDGVPWSTSAVLEVTLRRAAAAGLQTVCTADVVRRRHARRSPAAQDRAGRRPVHR